MGQRTCKTCLHHPRSSCSSQGRRDGNTDNLHLKCPVELARMADITRGFTCCHESRITSESIYVNHRFDAYPQCLNARFCSSSLSTVGVSFPDDEKEKQEREDRTCGQVAPRRVPNAKGPISKSRAVLRTARGGHHQFVKSNSVVQPQGLAPCPRASRLAEASDLRSSDGC